VRFLRYNRGATVNEILKGFPHVFPGYVLHLISRLQKGGYVELTRSSGDDLPISPVWLFLLTFLASAVSGCIAALILIRLL